MGRRGFVPRFPFFMEGPELDAKIVNWWAYLATRGHLPALDAVGRPHGQYQYGLHQHYVLACRDCGYVVCPTCIPNPEAATITRCRARRQ